MGGCLHLEVLVRLLVDMLCALRAWASAHLLRNETRIVASHQGILPHLHRKMGW